MTRRKGARATTVLTESRADTTLPVEELAAERSSESEQLRTAY